MRHVKDAVTHPAQTIEPGATLGGASARTTELGIGALRVQERDRLVGTLTDRDISIRSAAAAA